MTGTQGAGKCKSHLESSNLSRWLFCFVNTRGILAFVGQHHYSTIRTGNASGKLGFSSCRGDVTLGFTLIPHGFAVPPSPVRGKAAYRTDCGARPPGRAILLRLQAISKAAPPYALHLSNFRRAGLRLRNGSKFGIILGAAPSIPAPEGGEIHGPSRRILCVGRSKHSCLLCLQVA